MPPVREAVVIVSAAGAVRTMLKLMLDDWPFASVTVTEMLAVVMAGLRVSGVRAEATAACACAVPEMVRVFVSALTVSVSPAGRPVTVHLNGALPLLAVIEQE